VGPNDRSDREEIHGPPDYSQEIMAVIDLHGIDVDVVEVPREELLRLLDERCGRTDTRAC
jgi:hypothetical protein